MKDKIFIDTNILVYAYSENDPEKRLKARNKLFSLHFDDQFLLSTQTICEFTATLSRNKIKTQIIKKYYKEIVNSFPIVVIDLNIIENSYRLKDKYSLSWYDALIVSTSLYYDCNILYTEDLRNLTLIENKLSVINPLC